MLMTHRLLRLVMIAAFSLPLGVSAEPDKPSAHHEAPASPAGTHDETAHKFSHNFTAHWIKTLNDDQKMHVDMMHLVLDRELVVLKAQEELIQKQINRLVAQDAASTNAVHAKIDELMSVKKQILRTRYSHITEMRALLTPAQRISYDMETLEFSGVK